jgi:hypothetical protein
MATGQARKASAKKATVIAKKATATKATAKQATAKQATAKKATAKKTMAPTKKTTAAATKAAGRDRKRPTRTGNGPVLLSGGNPQIPKGEGRAPVQAYLDAMPGWKGDIGVALDAVIVRTVPDAHLWVKWNSPFYGADDQTWFASFHCFDSFVRVTFSRGESLDPVPAGASKLPGVRYHDVREHDDIDEAGFASWVEQASRLPGERF